MEKDSTTLVEGKHDQREGKEKVNKYTLKKIHLGLSKLDPGLVILGVRSLKSTGFKFHWFQGIPTLVISVAPNVSPYWQKRGLGEGYSWFGVFSSILWETQIFRFQNLTLGLGTKSKQTASKLDWPKTVQFPNDKLGPEPDSLASVHPCLLGNKNCSSVELCSVLMSECSNVWHHWGWC